MLHNFKNGTIDEVVFLSLVAITIGFTSTSYSVNECDVQVSIIVAVLKGSLKKRVALHLSTSDLTPNGTM